MRRALVLLVFLACRQTNAPGGHARVVSLMPSGTEVVAALGAADTLVGVDDYSTYPPEVAKLPKVGSFLSPNLEAIVRLRPTLVVLDDVHAEVAASLHAAHVATVECAFHALPDVKTALRGVGDALGRRARADELIAAIDRAVDEAAAHRPARHPRVLAVIDREAGGLGNMVAVGPGAYLDELLAVVGGDNVLAGALTRYPKISLEEVLRAKPEIILDLSKQAIDAWSQVPGARVDVLDAPYVMSPTPRVAEALDLLARSITSP